MPHRYPRSVPSTIREDRLTPTFLDGTVLDPDLLPEIVSLPRWAEPDRLRSATAIGVLLAMILAVLAIRLLSRVVVRSVVVIGLAVLAIGLWDQRTELGTCAATCACSLFGQVVKVPFDLNPRCS